MFDIAGALPGGGASFIATIIGSFSGGGMSLVLFPLLRLVLEGSYASLFTMSKVSATVMSMVAGKMHLRSLSFNRAIFLCIVSSGLLGTAVGTYLVQYRLNENLYSKILGTTLLVVACYLLFNRKVGIDENEVFSPHVRDYIYLLLFSVAANILNGLFGGSGIFLTVYLVAAWRMTMRKAIGYTFSSFFLVNLIQTTYLLTTTSVNPFLTIAVAVGSVVGSWVGTHAQFLAGNVWVKRATIIIMAVLGVGELIK